MMTFVFKWEQDGIADGCRSTSLFGTLRVSVCLFSLLLLLSGHFHQRGTSKDSTVFSWYFFSSFHQTRKFYGDFGLKHICSLWVMPEIQMGEVQRSACQTAVAVITYPAPIYSPGERPLPGK